MRRYLALAVVGVLAAAVVGCSDSQGGNPLSTVSPSSVSSGSSSAAPLSASGGSDATAQTQGRSGGGGKKPGGGSTGGTTGGSSLSWVMVTDTNNNGVPNWGEQIRFNVSTTATTEPNVNLSCTQNGVVVYGALTGYYASYPWPWTNIMTLSSNSWQGGQAECTAVLNYYSGTSTINLASITFTVLG